MGERVLVECFPLGELAANCYLVRPPAGRRALVVDPGGDPASILAALARERLEVDLVVNTHGHYDHIRGNGDLLRATGAILAVGVDDAPLLADAELNLSLWLGDPFVSPPPARLLRHGDRLTLDALVFEVRATPGHTPGGISLVGEGLAFTGDSLFAGGIGRTDFPGGSLRALTASIRTELLSLPDETMVFPGHGPSTTIGAERSGNPFLRE